MGFPVGALLARKRSSGTAPPATPASAAGPGLARDWLTALARSLPGVTTMHVPDRAFPWYGPAVGVGLRVLRARRYDAILSTSPPPTAHLVAATLSGLTGVPWVADYRDLWSGNHATALGPVRRRLEQEIERRCLSGASAIVSVSDPFGARIGRLHGRRVEVVTNGFDPAEVDEPARAETPTSSLVDARPLTLAYTGAIYSEYQDPAPLLAGIARLRDREALAPGDLMTHFYGSDQGPLPALVAQYGVGDFVRCHGFVPRDAAVAAQRAADALVVLDWNAPQERGVLPLKALEYLQARRPILVVGARRDALLVRLLGEARVGTHCTSAQEVATTLAAWLAQHKTSRTGRLHYAGDPDVIDRYSWPRLARDYAALLAAVAR